MAYITKGIQFQWIETIANASGAFSDAKVSNGWTKIETDFTCDVYCANGLQEIGEVAMNSSASNGFDQIEITTLADSKHMYMDGLEADGDANDSELTLKYLYSEEVFEIYNLLKDEEAANNRTDHFYIALPEGGFNVEGKITKVSLDSVGVNAAMTMSVTLVVEDITFGAIADPNA